VYSRADLTRTGAIVVTLFSPAVTTSRLARQFRADIRAGAIDLNCTELE
jgi:hypothetical protein